MRSLPDISPQTAINYEIGLKSRLGPDSSLDVALFYIQLNDELIAFRDTTDRVFYRNAGESKRVGAELGLTHHFRPAWRVYLAYTYMTAKFETYEKQGVDLSGNHVPGLPKHCFFAELRYANAAGFYATGDLLSVNSFFVDDENTVKNDAHTIINLSVGFEKKFKGWRAELFCGVRNLIDERYSNNVRINANGGRYFEPAPGRNWYGGVRIRI